MDEKTEDSQSQSESLPTCMDNAVNASAVTSEPTEVSSVAAACSAEENAAVKQMPVSKDSTDLDKATPSANIETSDTVQLKADTNCTSVLGVTEPDTPVGAPPVASDSGKAVLAGMPSGPPEAAKDTLFSQDVEAGQTQTTTPVTKETVTADVPAVAPCVPPLVTSDSSKITVTFKIPSMMRTSSAFEEPKAPTDAGTPLSTGETAADAAQGDAPKKADSLSGDGAPVIEVPLVVGANTLCATAGQGSGAESTDKTETGAAPHHDTEGKTDSLSSSADSASVTGVPLVGDGATNLCATVSKSSITESTDKTMTNAAQQDTEGKTDSLSSSADGAPVTVVPFVGGGVPTLCATVGKSSIAKFTDKTRTNAAQQDPEGKTDSLSSSADSAPVTVVPLVGDGATNLCATVGKSSIAKSTDKSRTNAAQQDTEGKTDSWSSSADGAPVTVVPLVGGGVPTLCATVGKSSIAKSTDKTRTDAAQQDTKEKASLLSSSAGDGVRVQEVAPVDGATTLCANVSKASVAELSDKTKTDAAQQDAERKIDSLSSSSSVSVSVTKAPQVNVSTTLSTTVDTKLVDTHATIVSDTSAPVTATNQVLSSPRTHLLNANVECQAATSGNAEQSDTDECTEESDALYIDTTADMDSDDNNEFASQKQTSNGRKSSTKQDSPELVSPEKHTAKFLQTKDSQSKDMAVVEICDNEPSVINVGESSGRDQLSRFSTGAVEMSQESSQIEQREVEEGSVCNLTIESVTSLRDTNHGFEQFGMDTSNSAEVSDLARSSNTTPTISPKEMSNMFSNHLVIQPIPLPPLDVSETTQAVDLLGNSPAQMSHNLMPIVSMVSSLHPGSSSTLSTLSNKAMTMGTSPTVASESPVMAPSVVSPASQAGAAAPSSKRRKRKQAFTTRKMSSSELNQNPVKIKKEKVDDSGSTVTKSSVKLSASRSSSTNQPRGVSFTQSPQTVAGPVSVPVIVPHYSMPRDSLEGLHRFVNPDLLTLPHAKTILPAPAVSKPRASQMLAPRLPFPPPYPVNRPTPVSIIYTPPTSTVHTRPMHTVYPISTVPSKACTQPTAMYTASPNTDFVKTRTVVYPEPTSKVQSTLSTGMYTVSLPASSTLRQLVASSHSIVIPGPAKFNSSLVLESGLQGNTPKQKSQQKPVTRQRSPSPVLQGHPNSSNMAYLLEKKLKTGQTNYILKRKEMPNRTVAAAGQSSTTFFSSSFKTSFTGTETLPTTLQLKRKLILGPNVIPNYKAPVPPPSLRFKKEVVQYRCPCGDQFALQSSLDDHLARKSMAITYECGECKNQCQFFNKCSMLVHVKEHSNPKDGIVYVNVNKLGLKQLPDSLMPKLKSNPSFPGEETSPMTTATQSSSAKLKECVKNTEKRNTSPAAPEVVSYTHQIAYKQLAYSCEECHMKFRTQKSLTQHFQKGIKQLISCNKCLMVLPHSCAFQAHQRIHTKEEPFICPDCGLHYKGPRDLFMKHVKKVCLHFSRKYEVICPLCMERFSLLGSLQSHIEEVHQEVYFKCLGPKCATAFRTWSTFLAHRHTHAECPPHEKIFKCPFCYTVYESVPVLKKHIKIHVTDYEKGASYVYSCTECKKVYAKKLYLRQHLQAAHPEMGILAALCEFCHKEFKRYKDWMEHSCFQDKEVKDQHPENSGTEVTPQKDHVDETSNRCGDTAELGAAATGDTTPVSQNVSTWECDRCQVIFGDEETYKRHKSKHLFLERKRKKEHQQVKVTLKRIKVEETQIQEPIMYTGEVKRQVPMIDRDLNFGCSECPERFTEEFQLDEHLRQAHDIHPQHPCHLCGMTYSGEQELKRHLEVSHESNRPKLAKFTCWWCQKKNKPKLFQKRTQLEKHLINFHRLTKARMNIEEYLKREEETREDLESTSTDKSDAESGTSAQDGEVRKLKVEGGDQFVCAKCSFSTTSREEFSKHIPKHQTHNDTVQCLECGLCFTVRPTLKMHLFVVHKVRDFTKYATETGMDMDKPIVEDFSPPTKQLVNGHAALPRHKPKPSPPKPLPSEESQDDAVYECNVCYRTFDDDTSLHKHMRTHGMAFIRSKRLQNMELF